MRSTHYPPVMPVTTSQADENGENDNLTRIIVNCDEDNDIFEKCLDYALCSRYAIHFCRIVVMYLNNVTFA